MKEFLAPFWTFLFDKFGIFGLLIVTAIPGLLIALVVVIVTLLRRRRPETRKQASPAAAQPPQGQPKQDPEPLYERGNQLAAGSREDLPEAFLYYLRAASLGHVPAQYEAGKLYYYGFPDQPANQEQGLYWLKKSAEGGSIDARIELGRIYNGKRYQDPGICLHWLEEVAEEDAEAQYLLSGLYSRKLEWYQRKKNYAPGQWKEDPQCVQWHRKSDYWLEKAAENGNEKARELYY